MTICPFCQKPVEHSPLNRFEVLGWEKNREAGGTNALELRERTGKVAHGECIRKAKRVHPDQGELFDT